MTVTSSCPYFLSERVFFGRDRNTRPASLLEGGRHLCGVQQDCCRHSSKQQEESELEAFVSLNLFANLPCIHSWIDAQRQR